MPSGGHRKVTLHHLAAVKRMIASIARNHPELKDSLTVDTWSYNRTWMVRRVRKCREEGLPVTTWTHKYLTAMSLGPWQIQGQLHQKNCLLYRIGDAEWSTLRPRTVTSLPFNLPWQRRQALAFHKNLRALSWTLDGLCKHLRRLTGDGAYGVLATLSDVTSYSKCLDFFVREALRLDPVPVDRHVRKLLKEFALDRLHPSELALLIGQAGFEPRLVARALYAQGL